MTAPRSTALYSPQMLALAVELADYPWCEGAPATGEARSRTCGSTLALSSTSRDRLSGIGLRVTACAVGQAAAAIFAAGCEGLDREAIVASTDMIEQWLGGSGDPPNWPRLQLLAPAVPHSGRHEAILLPWRAALDALSNHPPPR